MSVKVKAIKFQEPETRFENFLDKHQNIRKIWWFLENIWDKLTFSYFRKRLKFAFDYGYFAYKNQYDFDSQYVFSLLSFKLKRLRKRMREHTYDSDHTRALELAIKLCDRLYDYDYEEKSWNKFNQKWGHPKTTFPRCTEEEGRGYYTVEFTYPDMTEEAKEQRGIEMQNHAALVDGLKARDTKWLFDIMQKHIWDWWD